MYDYLCTICFSVSEISCKKLTYCTETGGKCKSSKTKGIHCECGDAIEYDKTLGCKGKDNFVFNFTLTSSGKNGIYLQLLKLKR